MNLRTFLASLALFFVAAAASPGWTAEAPTHFSPERFRSHVAFLSDDLLEGREAGSRGYEIAAAYVATQLAGLGLLPAGEDKSWFQRVALRSAELVGGGQLTIATAAGTRSWKNRTDILFGPSVHERAQDIASPVVFAGYGLHAPEHRIDDYRGLNVRGKIVVVLSGSPADLPSEKAAYLESEKYAVAARRGAIGLVSIDTDRSEKAVPWDVRLGYAGGPSMTWLGKDGRAYDEAPGLRFSARLNAAAATVLFANARKSYAALRAEAAPRGARPRGFPLDAKLRIQRSSSWNDTSSPNVVGLLPGSDPELRNEYVVLTGHLDGVGLAKDVEEGKDRIRNGALDNAAGIATLLETARAFASLGERPRRSILFVAVTAEEKGLLGSDYFAQHPTVPRERMVGAVNLDMPLLLYDFTDVVAFGAEHSTVATFVAAAANSMGLALIPDPMPEQSIFVRSDHYMFVRQGVPAIMLATGYGNGGSAKWREFLTGNYHGVKDDVSQPIDWQAAARFARLNYLIARSLADSDARPLWYRGDFFGQQFAPKARKAPPPR